MPKLANKYNCSGCLSCVDSCNTGALYSRWNEEGHLTYGFVADKCVECHRCERNCPAVNGYVHGSNELNLSTPYAAWCEDGTLRKRSTSGGVFAALAVTVLRKGGVVVGASMRNNEIKHTIIDKEEDLHLLQGSKYAQSDTTGTYRQVYEYLMKDRYVLFSGLGCQVAGLLNYLPSNKQYDKLFTIDLICGGIPSRALITKYLEHEKETVMEIKTFRNKEEYELTVMTNEGVSRVVPLSTRPLPLCGFYTELTNKLICYKCKYVGAHRKSDITIGDLWGDNDFPDEHKKGLSVVVTHSKKIEHLLKESPIEYHIIPWKGFLMNNPRMVYGNNILENSRERRLLNKIHTMEYQDILETFANAANVDNPVSFLKKIIRFIKIKYNHQLALLAVKKILLKYENRINNILLFL